MKDKIKSDSPLKSHNWRVATATGNIHRTTPEWFVEMVRKFYGGAIGLDPCPNPMDSVEAKTRYLLPDRAFKLMRLIDEAQKKKRAQDPNYSNERHKRLKIKLQGLLDDKDTLNGLRLTWRGFGGVFANVPYGRELPEWCEKMALEFEEDPLGYGKDQLITLLPAEVGAQWCQDLVVPICHAAVVIRGRLTFGPGDTPAPFWSLTTYTGNNAKKFRRVFGKIGWVVK